MIWFVSHQATNEFLLFWGFVGPPRLSLARKTLFFCVSLKLKKNSTQFIKFYPFFPSFFLNFPKLTSWNSGGLLLILCCVAVQLRVVLIPILSCIFGFPVLVLLIICGLRFRAKRARKLASKRCVHQIHRRQIMSGVLS